MHSLPIPFTGARLDVMLPFGFLPSALQPVVLLVLVAGCLVLPVWLYRVELRRVGPRVGRVLLVLRVGAVGAVALVVAASPVVVRGVRETRPGRVLVAVDVSDSMRVTDPDRTVGDKLRIARALKLHDGIAPDEYLDVWIADVERDGAPQFPPPGTDAGVARRLMFDEIVRAVDALSRVQAAGRALTPDGGNLVDRLKPAHAVEVIGFGQSALDLPPDPDALRAALAGRSPGGAFTDLKLPLARVAGARGESPVVGVVVLTDGRHNWGEPPAALARALGEKGVPVFPVNAAPRGPASDVAVVSVKSAVSTVCRGSSAPVVVEVRATRWPAGRVEVELTLPDGPPLRHTIPHDGADRTHEVTFHPSFPRPGVQVLTASARAEKPDPRPENDSRTARVTVVGYRPRVLLIDGEARWEFRYLRAALVRSKDPELEVKTVVFRQPRIGNTPDPDAEKAGLPALALPDDPEVFTGFDCVVLGDVTAEQFPTRHREQLGRFVSDAGGTLVVVAGKRSVPVGLADRVSEFDPLRKLLPIRVARVLTPPDGFRPELTPDGRRAWFLRMGDTPDEDRAVWDGFPAHGWAAVGEAKDGAEVLAWVGDPTAPPSAPNRPPERKSVLIARQHYGFGRVLYTGLDSTWRWRFKTGDAHHHRFWKQTVLWASAGRLLPAQTPDGAIRFGTREASYPAGQEVEFVLRATDRVPQLPPTAAPSAKLLRLADGGGPGETVAGVVPLQRAEGRPRELAARFRDLPPGRYAVEPEIPEWAGHLRGPAGPGGRPRAAFEVLTPASEELTELTANLPLLEGLARESGGRVFELADVDELAGLLAARTAVKEYEAATPLRRSWWTLGLVALLLAAEWVVRKWSGLP